jgi:hypothetical protein
VNNDQYFPDSEEVFDTMKFFESCIEKDLVDGWQRVSCEWDPKSVIAIHKSLCKTGRISAIVSHYTKK